MLWNRIVLLSLGVFALFAHSSSVPPKPVVISDATSAEKSAYDCAVKLGGLLFPLHQTGPLFAEDDLVFTSVDASDGSRLLIASAGTGLFAFRLASSGVNRIRFQLPLNPSESRGYFLSYLHGGSANSRVFDFSRGQPPIQRSVSDYTQLNPVRAEHLLPHFKFAIYETAGNIVNALMDGQISREAIKREPVRDCNSIAGLKRNVDMLEMMVLGPRTADISTRLPASLSH